MDYSFSKYTPSPNPDQSPFEQLLNIYEQLLLISSADVGQALEWLNEIDRQHKLTTSEYGVGNFIEDLKDKGLIAQDPQDSDMLIPTPRAERGMRIQAMDDIFGKLKKSGNGNHKTPISGPGDESNANLRNYNFGDSTERIDLSESVRNAQIRQGIEQFDLQEQDLVVSDQDMKTQTSTVLMIDISHSMILYGEDRITPAKRTAMALAEYITTRYPKDTLDIIVFGNDAWQVYIKDLPYLKVGPFHTNTVAGLELSMDLLRRRKNKNKQIFMITDGKPTCLKENGKYYKNSFGLDNKIVAQTLNLAAQCRRLHIPITTFMIATDPYLQEFVEEFTEVNRGQAYYSSLKGLGQFVFDNYQKRKKNR